MRPRATHATAMQLDAATPARAGDGVFSWFPPARPTDAKVSGMGTLVLRFLWRLAVTAVLVGEAVIGSKLLQALR